MSGNYLIGAELGTAPGVKKRGPLSRKRAKGGNLENITKEGKNIGRGEKRNGDMRLSNYPRSKLSCEKMSRYIQNRGDQGKDESPQSCNKTQSRIMREGEEKGTKRVL